MFVKEGCEEKCYLNRHIEKLKSHSMNTDIETEYLMCNAVKKISN